MDILSFAVVLIATGAVSGLVAGLLGVGGGIVVVPVLFYLLPLVGVGQDVQMHIAVATSLSTIIPVSIVSARSHNKRGGVDWGLLRSVAPGVLAGSVIGVALGGKASGELLTAVFAAVAMIVAIHMAFFKGRVLAEGLPGQPWRSLLGAMIGGISVLMGIGGGTLSVPTFTLCGVPIRRAVGTAAAIGLLIALPGTAGFAIAGYGDDALPAGSLGYVNLIGLVILAPISMLLAPLGARLAHTMPVEWLSRVFALFLATTSIRMFLSL